MSNVIRFRGRSRPPPPTTDDLIGELTAVQIELARAQLAQVRSETRQAQALWGWYCFKRAVIWGLVLWLLCTFMAPAKAQNHVIHSPDWHDADARLRIGVAVTKRDYISAGGDVSLLLPWTLSASSRARLTRAWVLCRCSRQASNSGFPSIAKLVHIG
jgi:hypothetical protein